MVMNDASQPQRARLKAFALAGLLALTVLTGGAAVTGLRQRPAAPARTQVVQVQPAAPVAPHAEESD